MNFDPQILTMVRETECMARLGLEIPPLAVTMRAKQAEYKDNYNALQVNNMCALYTKTKDFLKHLCKQMTTRVYH